MRAVVTVYRSGVVGPPSGVDCAATCPAPTGQVPLRETRRQREADVWRALPPRSWRNHERSPMRRGRFLPRGRFLRPSGETPARSHLEAQTPDGSPPEAAARLDLRDRRRRSAWSDIAALDRARTLRPPAVSLKWCRYADWRRAPAYCPVVSVSRSAHPHTAPRTRRVSCGRSMWADGRTRHR